MDSKSLLAILVEHLAANAVAQGNGDPEQAVRVLVAGARDTATSPPVAETKLDSDTKTQLSELESLGFDSQYANKALAESKGNVQEAIDLMVNGKIVSADEIFDNDERYRGFGRCDVSSSPQVAVEARAERMRFQVAALKLWPAPSRRWIRATEFADVCEKLPASFIKQFGSGYQQALTRSHFLRLYWLAIPEADDIASLFKGSFVRVLSALFPPVIEGSKSTRWAGPTAATIIDCLYNALHGSGLLYHGDLSRIEAEDFLQQYPNEPYVLRLGEPNMEFGGVPGIILAITLSIPITMSARDSDYSLHMPLLRSTTSDCTFWLGLPEYSPSIDLKWLGHFATTLASRYQEQRKAYEERLNGLTWQCSKCLNVMEVARSRCKVCQDHRPPGMFTLKSWNCGTCSWVNPSANANCIKCGAQPTPFQSPEGWHCCFCGHYSDYVSKVCDKCRITRASTALCIAKLAAGSFEQKRTNQLILNATSASPFTERRNFLILPDIKDPNAQFIARQRIDGFQRLSIQTNPCSVAEIRATHFNIQASCRRFWPPGRPFIKEMDFTKIMLVLAQNEAFTKAFGNDYQRGLTGEHYGQLFWLVMAKDGDSANMSEGVFTRAVASIYPQTKDWTSLTATIKDKISQAASVISMKDKVGPAASAISTMYRALYRSGLPYFGAISSCQADKLLQGTTYRYLLRLGEPGFESNGLDLILTVPYFVKRDSSAQAIWEHDIPLLDGDGFRLGNSQQLSWLGDYVSTKFVRPTDDMIAAKNKERWQCSTCCSINPIADLLCFSCGDLRPPGVMCRATTPELPHRAPEGWQCPKCYQLLLDSESCCLPDKAPPAG